MKHSENKAAGAHQQAKGLLDELGRGPRGNMAWQRRLHQGRRFPSERRAEQGNRRRLQEGRSYHD